MSITQINVSTPSIEILYTSTAMGNAVEAIKASSAKVFWIQVDNSANVAQTYVKFVNLASGSVTVGTTPPDLEVYAPPSSIITQVFFTSAAPGLTFGAALSAYAVTTSGTAGTVSPASSVVVTVSYV